MLGNIRSILAPGQVAGDAPRRMQISKLLSVPFEGSENAEPSKGTPHPQRRPGHIPVSIRAECGLALALDRYRGHAHEYYRHLRGLLRMGLRSAPMPE